MKNQEQINNQTAPEPKAPPPEPSLPEVLVFFLTRGQRRAVLRTLRELDQSREEALLKALEIEHQ